MTDAMPDLHGRQEDISVEYNETTKFEMNFDQSDEVRSIITEVLLALKEKGYNPINQLVGYFLSGDPTYITNHKGARAIIRRMERDELLEVILGDYIKKLENSGKHE